MLLSRKQHDKLVGVGFLTPLLLSFLTFAVYPLASGIVLSFFKTSGLHSSFVGLSNYKAFLGDPVFWKGVKNTLLFTALTVPVVSILPFLIAASGLGTSKRYQYFLRFAFYVPQLSSGIVIFSLWKYLFHPTQGLINAVLGTHIAWLGANPWAFIACEIVLLASDFGAPIILYLAKLLSIDDSLLDASRLDGCSWSDTARYVIFPLTMPVVGYVAITTTIATLQIWMIPYVLTGGGPNDGTTTIVLQVYQQAIGNGRWGYASAIALFLLVIALVFSFLQRGLLRSQE